MNLESNFRHSSLHLLPVSPTSATTASCTLQLLPCILHCTVACSGGHYSPCQSVHWHCSTIQFQVTSSLRLSSMTHSMACATLMTCQGGKQMHRCTSVGIQAVAKFVCMLRATEPSFYTTIMQASTGKRLCYLHKATCTTPVYCTHMDCLHQQA